MTTNVIQTALSSGELSPTLHARVDLARYHTGVAKMLNWFVDYRGGASTRPGTKYVAQAKDSSKPVRLIKFQFSTVQNYALEFGDFYMRIIVNGAPIVEADKTISNITKDVPALITAAGHGFSNGDSVYLQTQGGMYQLNQRTVLVSAATANTFIPTDLQGNVLDARTYAAFVTGTASRVYTIASPYAAEDLALLKFTQNADVITFTHTDYPTYDLIRSGALSWNFVASVIGAGINPPVVTLNTVFGGSGAASAYAYVITSVDADGNESIASAVDNIWGSADISAAAGSIQITWAAATGAVAYNVYKANPAFVWSAGALPTGIQFGFMASTTGLSAVDTNINPDFVYSPPLHTDPFGGGNYPGAVGYFQQRRVYGGSDADPETFWMSQPGKFDNFDVSNPVISSDAIIGTLVSQQVNNIKFFISMPGGLIVLTGNGAWQISGGSANNAVTPTNIVAVAQAYNGCSDIPPIPINYDILYIQQKGTIVRDLSYNFYTNIYTGADLTVFSNHLFSGFTILEWAYAEEPFKVVWLTRDDGKFLSLTYLKEQEVIGWAQHYTQGEVESVCSIQEGTEDAVYFTVMRTINGNRVRYIERMASRRFAYGVEDAWCLDSALGTTPNTPSATLSATAGTGSVTFTASAAVFTNADVGKVIRIMGGIATVSGYTDTTHLVGTFTTDVNKQIYPDEPVRAEAGDWSIDPKVSTFYGLSHLEGETLKALGDGNVFTDLLVTDGVVTIEHACSKIVIGMDFDADLQTLPLEVGEPTIQGKRKSISALTLRLSETRGLQAGPTSDTMKQFKERRATLPPGTPVPLTTGDERLNMTTWYTESGQIYIRQSNPLPATVLGIIPEITVGDRP